MNYSDDLTPREIAESYLTPDEMAATNRPVEEASVLPLKVYSNRAYFEREVEAVFRPSWHAVGRIDQLKETGSYITADIVGEPVMVIRDKDGTIRALSNVCRHRGAQLLKGCGNARAVVCPYHSWSYSLDGKLRGAPHMNNVKDFDRQAIQLPEFKVELWNGFVFVNLDPKSEPLAPQITKLTEALAPLQLEGWTTHPYMERTFDWNWKLSLENFTEAYHHVGLHQKTIGKISPAENALYEDTNDNYSLFYVDTGSGDGEFLPEDLNYPFKMVEGLPDFLLKYSPVVNIYPTFHVVIGINFVLWLQIEVKGAEEHRAIWSWLVPPGGAELPDLQERLDVLHTMISPVVTEDIEFLPQLKAAVRSQAFSPGRYCDQERAVHQMHKWLIRKMAGTESAPTGA